MRSGVSDAGGPIGSGGIFPRQAGGARTPAGFRSLIAVLVFLAIAGCGGSSSTASTPAPGAAPVLSVTPGSLAFTGQAGGANPASQTVSVTNTGGGTLPWVASDNATWLSATPASGAAPSTVSVSVDLSGLAAGTYGGMVTITSTGVTGSPKNIPVTLTVTSPPGAAPVLSVTPGSLAFTGQAGGANPASQTVSVTNTGGGTLPWVASDNATWLSATPASGAAPSTVSVSVDLSGLAAGTYGGMVTITSTGVTGSPKNIPVTLTVTAPPPGPLPQISLAVVAGGFVSPVHVTHAGDGSGRIFVVEQAGRIRILDNVAVLPTSFLDLASINPPRLIAGGEQGLLSVAFPPGFAAKGHFYVNYTRAPDGATVVARYRVSAGDANVADPASEAVILTIPQPFANHNGGQLAFGPDGYLYIGMGDGGSGGDPQNNGQSPGALLGKLLRIDVESGAAPYAVPPDNPFVGVAGFRPEIWALGLRNPWRFSFDRGTGDLYIGDVGQNAFEEVDFQPAGSPGGQNYGWNIMEGDSCYPPGTAGCNRTGLALPVFVYAHVPECSVTGGHVYRGSAFPPLQGIYLFGDYCSGRIWGLRRNGTAWDNMGLLTTPALNISTFGEDEEGNVYVANHTGGEIRKILSP